MWPEAALLLSVMAATHPSASHCRGCLSYVALGLARHAALLPHAQASSRASRRLVMALPGSAPSLAGGASSIMLVRFSITRSTVRGEGRLISPSAAARLRASRASAASRRALVQCGGKAERGQRGGESACERTCLGRRWVRGCATAPTRPPPPLPTAWHGVRTCKRVRSQGRT